MNWVFGELAFSLIGFRQIAHSVTGLLGTYLTWHVLGRGRPVKAWSSGEIFFLYINWGPAVKCSSVQAELTWISRPGSGGSVTLSNTNDWTWLPVCGVTGNFVLLNLENYEKDLVYVMHKTNIPFKSVGNKTIKVPDEYAWHIFKIWGIKSFLSSGPCWNPKTIAWLQRVTMC